MFSPASCETDDAQRGGDAPAGRFNEEQLIASESPARKPPEQQEISPEPPPAADKTPFQEELRQFADASQRRHLFIDRGVQQK